MGAAIGHEAIRGYYIQKPDGTTVNLAEAIMNNGSAIAFMDEPHAEIHRGMTYAGGKVSEDLADAAKLYLVGQNANTNDKDIHLTAAFSASGDVIVRTLGGITGVTGGTSVSSYNRSTGATDSGVTANIGGTPTGTLVTVKEMFIPGGLGPTALGGQAALRAERIVANNAWIGLEIENVSGQVIAHIGVEWDFYLADPIT